MKLLFIFSVTILLPLQFAAIAQANPTTVERPIVDPSPPASSNSESIAPITVQQNPELVSPDARSARLNDQAQQINQNLPRSQTRSNPLREVLNLPGGMIIRGSSRGGIGIGTEY